MAPLTTDPRHLLVVLNPARRKALYMLVSDITAYMRSHLELPPDPEKSTSGRDPQRRPAPLSHALVRLRKAALLHLDSWRAEVLGKLKDVVASPDDQKVLDDRRARAEGLARRRAEVPGEGEDLLSFGEGEQTTMVMVKDDAAASSLSLQHLYHPIPTRLCTIPLDDRKEVLSCVLLLLLAMGNYSAHSRALMCYLSSALEVPAAFLDGEERAVATTMIETAQKADAEKKKNGGMSAEAEAQKRKDENKVSRYWKVGLASVAGAAIVGVTGGLAAPVVAGAIGGLMGTVGLGSLASFLGIFWMNGALVGTLFGAFGARMTSQAIDQYAKEVEDFRFLPLMDEWGGRGQGQDHQQHSDARRLRVTIGVNGWLTTEEDVTKPWRVLGDDSEVFALRYEMRKLLALGASLRELVASYAWGAIRAEILKRTVMATLYSALWPVYLLNMASNVDNPFSLARNRSEKAGKILADALINRVQGERPVTLVGYSLGARVIFSCLGELAQRRAFGLVDSVVLIGSPIPSNPGHWQMMRTMVSGNIFNVYSTTSAQLGIAGLQAISEDVGAINIDLSSRVQGHLRYPEVIAKILTQCGFLNVKGGEGSIEKEESDDNNHQDIQLRNQDYAESGTLIDVTDEQRKEKMTPQYMKANEKFHPMVKNVQEQKSDFDVKSSRLMGHQVAEDHKKKSTITRTMPAAAQADDPLAPTDGRASGTTVPEAGSRIPAVANGSPPPSYSSLEIGGSFHHHDGDRYEYDSDEEGGGISMVDNDDMVEYMEPLRIED